MSTATLFRASVPSCHAQRPQETAPIAVAAPWPPGRRPAAAARRRCRRLPPPPAALFGFGGSKEPAAAAPPKAPTPVPEASGPLLIPYTPISKSDDYALRLFRYGWAIGGLAVGGAVAVQRLLLLVPPSALRCPGKPGCCTGGLAHPAQSRRCQPALPVHSLSAYPVAETVYERRDEGFLSLGGYMSGKNAAEARCRETQPVVMCYPVEVGGCWWCVRGRREGGRECSDGALPVATCTMSLVA